MSKFMNINLKRFQKKAVRELIISFKTLLSKNAPKIVVTNPPFSLFREYVAQLMEYDKKFLIIGNMNAIKYKEIFPLIKDNKIWPGVSPRSMSFKTPEGEIRAVNAIWFTNLGVPKIHKDLILHKRYNKDEYPKYDNYNAINVNSTKDIPMDYEGVMGVPITFLDKYNPKQFEILGFRKGSDGKDLSYTKDETKIYPFIRILIKNKIVAKKKGEKNES